MSCRIAAAAVSWVVLALPAHAMQLASTDVAEGTVLKPAQLYVQCGGGNVSPQFAWTDPPAGTGSFALTLYDPDAKGGWWHWIVYDIPPQVRELPRGAGSIGTLPEGARTGRNDYGHARYDGACPPPGSGTHRYEFTLWALSAARLPLDGADNGMTIGPYLKAHALAETTLSATYER